MSHALGFSKVTVPLQTLHADPGSGQVTAKGTAVLSITVSRRRGRCYLNFRTSGEHDMFGGAGGNRLPIVLKDIGGKPLQNSRGKDVPILQFARSGQQKKVEIGAHKYVEVLVGRFYDHLARQLVTLNIPR